MHTCSTAFVYDRQVALQHGALRLLVWLLRGGLADPLSVDVLRCLYVFVRGDNRCAKAFVTCSPLVAHVAFPPHPPSLPVIQQGRPPLAVVLPFIHKYSHLGFSSMVVE